MINHNLELLAPAGNIESFKAAVNAGADAVYMGLGKHNARVMAKNFTIEDYIECIFYAHIRNVKVYLTLNTLVLDDEIEEIMQMLSKLYEAGLDAVILQDIGLAQIIHKVFPDLHMHASTQMSVYSIEQVRFLEKLGFKRVVLARELTLDEINEITQNTEVEIEAFIHGALCVSVSGQCLLSEAIGGRSANRGACAQPCRMRYTLKKQKGEIIKKDAYLLSKKDIFSLDILDKVIESNITSLKIEGRNKTPEYVAFVISRYRKYIDKYKQEHSINLDLQDEENTLQIFNRSGKSHGYLQNVEFKDTITEKSPKNTGVKLGEVVSVKGKLVKVKLTNDIDMHDGIEIYTGEDVISTIVTCIKDEHGNLFNCQMYSGRIVYIGDINKNIDKIKAGDAVYKTSKYSLNLDIQKRYIKTNIRKREMVLNVTIKKDSPITLSTIINNKMYIYNTNVIAEIAQTKDITQEQIEQIFSKTNENGVSFVKVVGYIEKGLFLRVATLNDIRRNFIEKVEEKFCEKRDVKDVQKKIKEALNIGPKQHLQYDIKNILSCYRYNSSTNYVDEYKNKYGKELERIDIQASDYILNEKDIIKKYSNYNLGIVLSNFMLKNMDKYINENLERLIQKGVKTIILGSYRYYELVKDLKEKYNIVLVADYSLNAYNSYSTKFLKEIGFDVVTLAFGTIPEQAEKMSKITNIEVTDDYITVMTSRYCVLGTFVSNRKNIDEICKAPCLKEEFVLIDTYGEEYNVICNKVDCTMKIIKKHTLNNMYNNNLLHIRNNTI